MIQTNAMEKMGERNMNEAVESVSLLAGCLVCVRRFTCMFSFGSPVILLM